MQHHPIPGHGMVEFFPSEAIDTLHLLFNIKVLPTLVSQQLGLIVFTCLGLKPSCCHCFHCGAWARTPA